MMLTFQLKSNLYPRIEEGWEGTCYLFCRKVHPLTRLVLNLPSMAHTFSLSCNFPPPNPVLSFLFKVGMVVYEVAAKKNMIFKIRTCWSWWYQLGEAIYKWGKDDALFITLDLFVSWVLFVRSRERQACCHPCSAASTVNKELSISGDPGLVLQGLQGTCGVETVAFQ